MSQPNAWAARQQNSQSASRTPQNRSSTTSPNLQNSQNPQNPQNPTQTPRQEPPRAPQPPANVWAQRSTSARGSNGQARVDSARVVENTSFNAAEVKAFLARDASSSSYKPVEAPGGTRNSGAWGSKPGTMANGQPFFVQLAKQLATMEGGG